MNLRFFACCLLLTAPWLCGADWLQFRGTTANSVATNESLPKSWSEEKGIAWKAELVGRGVSCPIVVGERVIVTADSGPRRDRLHVLSFDAKTGAKQWERQFWATGRTFCHPVSAVAANTPASDGERIFAFYSSNDLICLDLEGNLLWYRGLTQEFPHAANDVGMSSSPVVADETVVVQVENQGDSFAAGIDVHTGATRWKLDRPRSANWVSPSVARGPTPAADQILLQSAKGVSAHEPRTGKVLWSQDADCNIIVSPTVVNDLVLVPTSGLTAYRRSPGSDTLEKLWQASTLSPSNASPIVDGQTIYCINSGGVLNAGETQGGKTLWQLRLSGRFWATPVVASGHLYGVNQDGKAFVVKLGDKEGEVVHEFEFGEPILASPVAAGGALYFRSDKHLWKIAE